MVKRAVFIGRWSPFHKGHLEIMKGKIEQGIPLLILIRDTPYDIYPPQLRKRMIEAAMRKLKVDAKVMIIDDIESVNYGRGVGYEVNQIEVPEDVKRISATRIREMIARGDESWKDFIPEGAAEILEKYLSRKGVVVWFTGLPKSGKKTIARETSYLLERHGIFNEVIDSKLMRETISRDLGFSKEDRNRNIERAMHVAKLLARNGTVVLAAFITPYEYQRQLIRKELEKECHFLEVYVKCPLEVCEARDDEGIYEKARRGEIANFTGISDPYEEPGNPDIVIDSVKLSPREAAEKIVEHVLSLV